MIRIRRTGSGSTILKTKGRIATQADCQQYEASPQSFVNGKKKFNSGIYGDNTVREKLGKLQHGKCCFCEAKHEPTSFGDIEHFRPMRGYCRSKKEKTLCRPGYYWLAYEWSNLLIACQQCNQRYKRNYFPLADENKRAKSHHDDITQEEPLLINPAEDDPGLYLSFREADICAIDGNLRGKTTIELLQLNRPVLIGDRQKVINRIREYEDTLQVFKALPKSHENVLRIRKIKTALRESQKATSAYSATARAYFAAKE